MARATVTMRNQNGDLVVIIRRENGTEQHFDFNATALTSDDLVATLRACGDIRVKVKGERAEVENNVYDYFTEKLGYTPSDGSLVELGVDTPCGKDCVKVIDAAAALAHVVDMSVVGSVCNAAEEGVLVFWRG